MNDIAERNSDQLSVTRRYFLGQGAGVGIGAMALDGMLARRAGASDLGTSDRVPHFAPKAKRVIFLTQSGGPSQLELYDHKPGLAQLAGEKLPDSVRGGQRLSGMTEGKPQLVMPAHSTFQQRGQSGATVSDWLPHIAEIADELCFVKSMVTDQINHAPAMTKFLTGHHLTGRPSMGSWFSYGLGSENRDLPDYLVLLSKMKRGSDQPLYDHYWGSGFLPSEYQGVKLRSAKDPVLYLNDPEGLPRELRRGMLNGLNEINAIRQLQTGDPEITTRIQQYEMAYRMQASVPDLTDISDEPESTFEMYGPDSRRGGSYAANCILARRLAERGVRFIQLFHPDWDHHSRLRSWCTARCRDTDQASAALIKDLKQRGMLEDTLVIWGGEFGRSPAGQGKWDSPEGGRDHHPRCFTIWMAGGGVKSGVTYGATDDYSYNAVVDPVHVRDLHATVLHLMGIEHERFSYRSQGLDFRLTGVEPARVVHDILA
ncbi:MAG: sulfatase [Rhodopirellula sp.]|nr:sulfatase [Rhodopirellula sp.]